MLSKGCLKENVKPPKLMLLLAIKINMADINITHPSYSYTPGISHDCKNI